MTALEAVLLRRTGTVYVSAGERHTSGWSVTRSAAGLTALEAELLDRGHALTGPLHAALAGLVPVDLSDAGKRLLRALDAELGADRTHMPLFREFPRFVPRDTTQHYVNRVFALLLQRPEQPCVLCGTVGGVRPVSPCAHLVCHSCWDGEDHSGCPVCHTRIDVTDSFLEPARTGTVRRRRSSAPAGDAPLRLLRLGGSRGEDTIAALRLLLSRTTPPAPQDRDDLRLLLDHLPGEGLAWLPEDVAALETKALLLAALLRDPHRSAEALSFLPALLTTATDVLRLLCVWSGGEPDLVEPPRPRGVPRPLRRELLGVLDGFGPQTLIEELHRHTRAWKRAGEVLHPYEHHRRHPRTALAFAVLRGTDLSAHRLGPALRRAAAEHPEGVAVRGDRLAPVTWGGQVERALGARDLPAAVALLRERPGELVRRLDHLLRLHAATGSPAALPEGLAEALASGLARVGPAPLLSALGALRVRTRPGGQRVFFPRGDVSRRFAVEDRRAPLPQGAVQPVCSMMEAELLRRLAAAPRHDVALLDSGLSALTVPFAECGAARSLASAPQGGPGRSSRDLTPQDTTAGRVTLWDLACWHAGVRTDRVVVLRRAPFPGTLDELWHYDRQPGENTAGFAARIRALAPPEWRRPSEDAEALAAQVTSGRNGLLALVHGNVRPEGATGVVYRLFPGPVDGSQLTRVTAGELIAGLG
ncbi:MXAN_6230/SCO0854 family RING domain-containing protein [Streptomyces sp. 8N706]|uniref:MXAN_6230/SCO0854 family RING domain-containing protein n=1 Tax=Streptomyces sp. 8N706 TaxID=3457416 RepID=UPI003FD12A43